MMNRALRAVLSILSIIIIAPAVAPPLQAQAAPEWDAGRIQITRQGLEELLARFEQTAASEAYSPDFRSRARFEASLIRARLRDGDFQIGDSVSVVVEGESDLTGTFAVNEQRGISFPVIGGVSLVGVLRTELQSAIRDQIARFIKDPVVRARSSVRILISGEVGRPGFYVVDTNALLSDALMLAGGPAPTADLDAIRVERGNVAVWSGSGLQQAIAEGRTVDQLSLRGGDHVVVPADRGNTMSNVGRVVFAGIPVVLLALTSLSTFLGP
jgi:protein involved in polysaccharide export with SLBB domain